MGTYYYQVMPFGLHNVDATYQHTMTTTFHELIQKIIKIYVNDLIPKSLHRWDHPRDLQMIFLYCREYMVHLNPKKFIFGVTASRLLGLIIYWCGINVDPMKAKVILKMPEPYNVKVIQSFLC